jgi:hypothetical protein
MGGEEDEMYEKHLDRVHLSRLSPVMWSWKHGYPRKQLGVPIKPAYNAGMGAMGNGEGRAMLRFWMSAGAIALTALGLAGGIGFWLGKRSAG